MTDDKLNSEFVKAKAGKLFGDNAPFVIQLLESASFPLTNENIRIHLAILKLSNGDLSEFEDALKAAESDWRDVLLWSGLANADWHKAAISEDFI